MERKGTHRFNRDTIKTLLYVVGAIAGIAFLSSVFSAFHPRQEPGDAKARDCSGVGRGDRGGKS